MDQEQIFQKLIELERAQKRMQRSLDMLLERGGPKKWLDSSALFFFIPRKASFL
ncbi:MAG: hypothetical protein Q8S11_01930 [Daejeonella sp.]|uniref:hypothetical protein n=1 Tax=Daejeonella sp. TaxID=2805397 RepID=UPI0027362587|nr:hypothetical protein [Daejeonella sp.]MDP3467062.1 hypothetical protein [Daejeonella sp.]